jgi:hypothetical protein
MQNSRNSSVWKSLAAAFGDGLAFGVGMKLSQNAAKPLPPNSQPELPPAPLFDRKVLLAVVNAVEERLKEHAGQVEREIAAVRHDLDEALVGMRAELAARDGEIVQLRRQIGENGSASRDLLRTVGQACRDAADRVAPAEPAGEPASAVNIAAATD